MLTNFSKCGMYPVRLFLVDCRTNIQVDGMKGFTLFLVFSLLVVFALPVQAQQQTGINLKVGENFYFEGATDSEKDNNKEESMAEIQKKPFYKSTWFITTVSVVVLAGLGTGLYFLTKKDTPEGNVIKFGNPQAGK